MHIILFIWHHIILLLAGIGLAMFCVAQPVLAFAFLKKHWLSLVVIVAALLTIGYFEHVGAARQKAEDAPIFAKDAKALHAAAASLNASAVAINAQNAANAQKIHDAEQAVKDVLSAKSAADHAADQMARQIAGFGKRLEHARQNPPCDVLLRTDVAKVCGL